MNLKDLHTQRIKKFPIMVGVGIGILVIVTAILLVHSTTASATPTDLSILEIQYPAIVGSKIDNCAACHTSSIPNLNSFGYAYKLNGRNANALVAIQSLDSDGDGITNLQEIKAVAFPGAANIAPQAVIPTEPGYPPPESPTAVPTEAGYPPPGGSTASPTPLPTLTSTRTTAPTQTPTATRVPSNTPPATQVPSNTPAATRVPSNTPPATQVPSNTPPATRVASNTPAASRVPSNTPTSTQVPTHVPTSTQVVSKTPVPTRAVSMTPTRRVTDERRPTRTPRPTQISVCPTPRGAGASSGAALSEADRLRCSHGGGGGRTSDDWLTNWWNAFLARFRPKP